MSGTPTTGHPQFLKLSVSWIFAFLFKKCAWFHEVFGPLGIENEFVYPASGGMRPSSDQLVCVFVSHLFARAEHILLHFMWAWDWE